MTQKEKQEEINQRFLDFQTQTKYGRTPMGFKEQALRALSFSNPAAAKLKVDEFKTIVTKQKDDYSIWELGFVLKVMESRTANEMQMTLPEYVSYLEMIEGIVKKWRSIVQPENEKLNVELKEWLDEQVKIAEEEATSELENKTKVIPMPVAEA